MKSRIQIFAVVVSSFFILHSAFGQGALTPPGPPAPTMKSLDQIEARTPISVEATIATGCLAISGTNLITYKYNMP